MMRTHRSLGALGVLALLTTGCVPTLSSDDSSSASTTSSTPAAGRQPLDRPALQSALPTDEDLGAAWSEEPGDSDGEPSKVEDYSPPACAPLGGTGPMWEAAEATERSKASVTFERTRDAGSLSTEAMKVSIASHEATYPDALFDERARALGECTKFELLSEGEWQPYTAKPLAFPTLGDRTSAYRLTNRFELSDSVVVATFDIVNVKLGHNTVSVSHYSLDGIPDAHATATAVRRAVAGLEEQG